MSQAPLPSEIANLSFEEALAQLEEIVRSLESGNAKLDGAIEAYEKGTLLKRHCEMKLNEARAKVDKITISSEGTIQSEPTKISD